MSTARDRPLSPKPVSEIAPRWAGEKTLLLADDAVPSVFLQVIETGDWLPLAEFPAVIGRHDRAAVTLNDPSVSRRHAQIVALGPQGFAIEDLGSSNGIRVEGKRVERLLLMDGDQFELGRIAFKFSTQGPAQTTAMPHNVIVSSSPSAAQGSTDQFDPARFFPMLAAVVAVAVLFVFVNRAPPVAVPSAPPAASVPPIVEQTAPPEVSGVPVGQLDDAPPEVEDDVRSEQPAVAASPVPMTNVAMTDDVTEPVATPVKSNSDDLTRLAISTASGPAPDDSQKSAARVDEPPPAPAAKKVPKPVRSAAFSRGYIDAAMQTYVDGDSTTALRRLGIMSRSLRNRKSFRDEAWLKSQQIGGLLADYEQGQSALARGDREDAAKAWARFLRDEAKLLDGKNSVYAKRISEVVAGQFTRDGDAANADGRFHAAHQAWSKAAQYEPEGTASVSIARLLAHGQALYEEGYQLESQDIERATTLWREAVEVLPPGNEYHTKARAKLLWHEQARR